MEHGHGMHLPSGVGDSLHPHERPSVESEAARMNRGRGRQLGYMGAGIAVLAIGAVLASKVMDAQQLRSDAYAAVLRADDEHAAKFLRCALPGAEATQLTTSATLMAMIEHTSEQLGARHAALIGECASELGALEDQVRALRVPPDARDEREAVLSAVAETRRTWGEYQAYAEKSPPGSVNALPLMDKAAVAWTTYGERRKALEKALLPPISR